MKQKKRLLVAITFLIIVLVFWCFRPQVQSKIDTKQEQKRLDGILAEINDLYIANEDIQTQWHDLELQQSQLHGSAEENRAQIKNLWNEYYKDKDEWNVMGLVCELVPTSPMCGDYAMLDRLKTISETRWVDYKMLLGIMYHESKLWTAFAPSWECSKSNNRAWLKARKYDDGSVSEWFDKQDNRIDGCWLYNFDTVEDFFESLANTIALWYAQCLDRPEPVSCICNVYVGKYSQARVDSVRRFADYEFYLI